MPATPTKPSSGSLTGIGPWWRKLRERQSQALAEIFPSFVDTSFTTPKTRQAFMEVRTRVAAIAASPSRFSLLSRFVFLFFQLSLLKNTHKLSLNFFSSAWNSSNSS